MREKRQADRVDFQGTIKLRVLFTKSSELKEVDAEIANVSEGGVYIKTKEPLEEGALADLKFKMSGQDRKNPLGLVKWVKPGEGVGIEFFYSCEEEKEEIKRELMRLLEGGAKVIVEDTPKEDEKGKGGGKS